jgi:hypothetical protein
MESPEQKRREIYRRKIEELIEGKNHKRSRSGCGNTDDNSRSNNSNNNNTSNSAGKSNSTSNNPLFSTSNNPLFSTGANDFLFSTSNSGNSTNRTNNNPIFSTSTDTGYFPIRSSIEGIRKCLEVDKVNINL